jgi:hypothetical protein
MKRKPAETTFEKTTKPRQFAVATGSTPSSVVIDGARIVALAKKYAKGDDNNSLYPDVIVYFTFNAYGLQRVHTILFDDSCQDGNADIDIESEDFEAVCKNLIAETLRKKKEKRQKLQKQAFKKLTDEEQWALGVSAVSYTHLTLPTID